MHIALSQYSDSPKQNPYVWSLGRALKDRGYSVVRMPGSALFLFSSSARKATTIHLQWFEALIGANNQTKMLLKVIFFLLQLRLCKMLGKRLVWTVHNTSSHESQFPGIEHWATRMIAREVDHIVVHCESAKTHVCDYLGLKTFQKVTAIDHGNYIGIYPNCVSRQSARQKLRIPADVLVILFLGNIRPYKGLDQLVVEFNNLRLPKTFLLIAGKPLNSGLKSEIENRCNENPNILFHPHFVDDEQVQLYMNASDVVAFPYRNILTSGAVILAMSFAKPCIAPNIGCISSVANSSWNFLYSQDDQSGLRLAIMRAVDARHRLETYGAANFSRATQLNWDRIAAETARLYA